MGFISARRRVNVSDKEKYGGHEVQNAATERCREDANQMKFLTYFNIKTLFLFELCIPVKYGK